MTKETVSHIIIYNMLSQWCSYIVICLSERKTSGVSFLSVFYGNAAVRRQDEESCVIHALSDFREVLVTIRVVPRFTPSRRMGQVHFFCLIIVENTEVNINGMAIS